MAAVFCASFSRCAIIRRSRVIFTRSSLSPAGRGAGGALGAGAERGRRGAAGAGLRPRLDEGEHVALGQPAVLAARRDLRGVEAVLLDELAHRRRQGLRRCGAAAGALARRGRRRLRPVAPRPPAAAASARPWARPAVIGASALAVGFAAAGAVAFADGAQDPADLDLGALVGGDRLQRAAGRGVDLDRHLVGFQLDQRLVGRHRVADRLEPLRHGRFGYRLAQRRHDDVCRHGPARRLVVFRLSARHAGTVEGSVSRSTLSACSTSNRCSCSWILNSPVAGRCRSLAADVGRQDRIALSSSRMLISRGRTNVHAPVFAGSSWHQTTLGVGILLHLLDDQRPRPGVELLDADQGDVVDRRARAAPATGRSRPCRCRGPGAAPCRPRPARRPPAAPGRSASPAPGPPAARPPACGAAASWASSRSAACGSCGCICRRRTWKYCAGVVQLHDLHVVLGAELQEALQAGRDECSGPWPS